MSDGLVSGGRRTLVVLFIPSVQRDGKTAVDPDHWVNEAMKTFGNVYGGATPTRGRRVSGGMTSAVVF